MTSRMCDFGSLLLLGAASSHTHTSPLVHRLQQLAQGILGKHAQTKPQRKASYL